jgi:hypothetical protein
MTDISNDFINTLKENLAADIAEDANILTESQDADFTEQQQDLQKQVSQTLPFAVLQLLGVLHNNTRETSSGLVTTLGQKEFEYLSSGLQNVLALMGWEPVATGKDDSGLINIALVPLGSSAAQEEGVTENV